MGRVWLLVASRWLLVAGFFTEIPFLQFFGGFATFSRAGPYRPKFLEFLHRKNISGIFL
jgi:hypothetical protein